jgi:hypothetical protein
LAFDSITIINFGEERKMTAQHEIRADFDKDTIVVYQAYNQDIALPAIKNNKFSDPFSFDRMTWIKPSFLWMMERSNWGQKTNQEYTLAIRIKRSAWESALSEAIITHYEKSLYANAEIWKELLENTRVHVQWEPERSIRGNKLEYRSIQVGISRHLIHEYNREWIVEIKDYTALVTRLRSLCEAGRFEKAKDLLPKEKIYELPLEIRQKIGAN